MVISSLVDALYFAPISSKMRFTSSAECLPSPLKAMCSRKWLTPLTSIDSSRAPVRTKKAAATERTLGFSSAMTEMPLSSLVSWNFTGFLQRLGPDREYGEIVGRISFDVVEHVFDGECVDLVADFGQRRDPVEMVPVAGDR